MMIILIFLIGAAGYGATEILWRQRTHWTMLVCGGAGCLIIYSITSVFKNTSLIAQSIISAIMLTMLELAAGYFINIKNRKCVWDYSELPMNFKGQICLRYSILWTFLSFGVIVMINTII